MASSEAAAAAGWYRFHEVTAHIPTGHHLFRASSPNYIGFDASLKLTPEAVQYLKERGIDSLVSFNQHNYTEAERTLLDEAGISFLHAPVKDFTAATLEQLDQVYRLFCESKATLLHCGYGHGRTGTGVTAIQLYSTAGVQPPEQEWQVVNHVEKPVQMDVLRELKAKLKEER